MRKGGSYNFKSALLMQICEQSVVNNKVTSLYLQAMSPSLTSNSSPKHVKYETLLEKPGTYPTLLRKEEVPQLASGPQGYIK